MKKQAVFDIIKSGSKTVDFDPAAYATPGIAACYFGGYLMF